MRSTRLERSRLASWRHVDGVTRDTEDTASFGDPGGREGGGGAVDCLAGLGQLPRPTSCKYAVN